MFPFVHLTGGIRVHVDYANALTAAGHTVTIVYPIWPYRFQHTWREQVAEFRHNIRSDAGIQWCSTQATVLRVPAIRTVFLPESDVLIAVSWPTVHDVARVHSSRGRKVHSVMHHESGTGPEWKIRECYRFPLYRITYSRCVAAQLRNEFNCEVQDVLPHGINTRVFYHEPLPRREDTVLMLYHPDRRKGAGDGLDALNRVRARMPTVQVHLCGTVRPPQVPQWVQFTYHPSDSELRRLYSTSTALLYPSRVEGFGLPPLEAMACGCPVVTTPVGAVPEFACDGQNAFVVDPADTQSMADRLVALLADAPLRNRLTIEGFRTAGRYSVDCVAPLFEKTLLKAVTGS